MNKPAPNEDKYNFERPFDLSEAPILARTLDQAQTTQPQPVRKSLLDASTKIPPSGEVCVAVVTDQVALADAGSCDFLAAAGMLVCYSLFLRNPETTSSAVAHFSPLADELGGNEQLLAGMRKIAHKGDTLEMDIIGGDNDHARAMRSMKPGQPPQNTNDALMGLEETLGKVFDEADRLGVKVNPRTVNLFGAKTMQNAVLDLASGDLFYVQWNAVKRFIVDDTGGEAEPIKTVFDGLTAVSAREAPNPAARTAPEKKPGAFEQ